MRKFIWILSLLITIHILPGKVKAGTGIYLPRTFETITNESVKSTLDKYFSDFEKIYKENKQEIIKKYRETYIAPMYSYLINSNKKIKAEILNKEDFVVLGTPEDIISFDENNST